MKKIAAFIFATFLASPAVAQNYLRDDGIFHSVVEGTTNGQVLYNNNGVLGGLSLSALPLTVGTTPISGGGTGRLLYDNAGFLGETTAGNSSILVTDSGGVPSLSTTLPAFTLGGTVSGGGNSINNANIGVASPGTGNFTSIGASLPGTGSFTSVAYSTTLIGTSTNAACGAIGRQGATNPVLQVDCSTATVATGLKIKGAAAGAGLALSVITSGTNENLTFDAAGSGTITLGSVSTGAITLTRATTMSAALTYGGVTLANSVTGTGSMVLSTAPTLASPIWTGSMNGTSSNAGIEIGATASPNTPFIDFHSSGNSNDYDSRLLASGGSASIGLGTLGLTAAAFGIAAPSGTTSLNIGSAGVSPAVITMTGSSSGTQTWQTAAATSGTVTFFAGSDTVVGKATTDIFTNKTITSTTNVLGGVTMTLGSDATGDMYYRDSGGHLARLGIGTAGQILNVASGLPAWTTVSGTGTVTSITPGNGLVSSLTTSCSQTAITTTGTLSGSECLNAQTGTTYTIVDGDRAKLITGSNTAAQAYSIAQAGASSAFQNGWYTDVKNNSTAAAGVITITPTTSTINGATTLVLLPGQSARIVSDGTNYQVIYGTGQPLTNTLGSDVALSNTANYFDGPSVAQGTAGTWFASGTVSLTDTGAAAAIYCKLWDGTTVIASSTSTISASGQFESAALSGFLSNPAGNIRISCRDISATTGKIFFNQTGNSKDSTVSVLRIN